MANVADSCVSKNCPAIYSTKDRTGQKVVTHISPVQVGVYLTYKNSEKNVLILNLEVLGIILSLFTFVKLSQLNNITSFVHYGLQEI